MKIRMYDCGFGDCFRMTDDSGQEMFVDFGANNRQAIKDMAGLPGCDFLLTHYHSDHYRGIIGQVGNFRNIYIPDVWSISEEECVNVVALHLIHSKLYVRNKKFVSLLDFLIAICDRRGKIVFVKRGDEIGAHYMALWPRVDSVCLRAKLALVEVRSELGLTTDNSRFESNIRLTSVERDLNSVVFGRIMSISKEIRSCICQCSIKFDSDTRMRLLRLKNEFEKLSQLKVMHLSKLRCMLADFGNSISIVFQNKEACNNNILFNGDFGCNDNLGECSIVLNNIDGCVAMHSMYHVVKLSHHGTARYYGLFEALKPRVSEGGVLLITNGNRQRWKISKRYSMDANNKELVVYCARNNACEAAPKGYCCCFHGYVLHKNGNEFWDIPICCLKNLCKYNSESARVAFENWKECPKKVAEWEMNMRHIQQTMTDVATENGPF